MLFTYILFENWFLERLTFEHVLYHVPMKWKRFTMLNKGLNSVVSK